MWCFCCFISKPTRWLQLVQVSALPTVKIITQKVDAVMTKAQEKLPPPSDSKRPPEVSMWIAWTVWGRKGHQSSSKVACLPIVMMLPDRSSSSIVSNIWFGLKLQLESYYYFHTYHEPLLPYFSGPLRSHCQKCFLPLLTPSKNESEDHRHVFKWGNSITIVSVLVL